MANAPTIASMVHEMHRRFMADYERRHVSPYFVTPPPCDGVLVEPEPEPAPRFDRRAACDALGYAETATDDMLVATARKLRADDDARVAAAYDRASAFASRADALSGSTTAVRWLPDYVAPDVPDAGLPSRLWAALGPRCPRVADVVDVLAALYRGERSPALARAEACESVERGELDLDMRAQCERADVAGRGSRVPGRMYVAGRTTSGASILSVARVHFG